MDFWPLLLNSSNPATATPPQLHVYMPVTEDSIVWHGRWKLITSAALGGAYWFGGGGKGPNNTVIPANATEWPCVPPLRKLQGAASALGTAGGSCQVCSPQKPCLFDLVTDESERVNLAEQYPNMVLQLSQQLATANANRYVDGTMAAEELAKYDCAPAAGPYPRTWWGNFTGPCCRPKETSSAGIY